MRHLQKVYLPLLRRAARSYIAGPTFPDAARTGRSLAQRGIFTTICYWDAEGEPPRKVADEYLAALDCLPDAGVDAYLSIKAPSLEFRPDLLTKILDRAHQTNSRVHFDSLQPGTADRTFELIAEVLPHHPNLGCTLPGRWFRSMNDAARVAGLGLAVRVVKGQWADVGHADLCPESGFLRLIRALAGRARRVGVATHDAKLAHQALCQLRDAGTPCELELLYGLPVREPLAVARELKIPVRLYVPYGNAWLPYALRQAGRNPRVLWWILRDAIRREPRIPLRAPVCAGEVLPGGGC
jgi:proline dehydrogenase